MLIDPQLNPGPNRSAANFDLTRSRNKARDTLAELREQA
jgi:hypothetical protein